MDINPLLNQKKHNFKILVPGTKICNIGGNFVGFQTNPFNCNCISWIIRPVHHLLGFQDDKGIWYVKRPESYCKPIPKTKGLKRTSKCTTTNWRKNKKWERRTPIGVLANKYNLFFYVWFVTILTLLWKYLNSFVAFSSIWINWIDERISNICVRDWEFNCFHLRIVWETL